MTVERMTKPEAGWSIWAVVAGQNVFRQYAGIPKQVAIQEFWEEMRERGCLECGEPNDNGEGWDGLCGNCADITTGEDGTA